MRCLVGVTALALLALGGMQASQAASLVSPTICTNVFNGACDSGAGGLTGGTPGTTVANRPDINTSDFVTMTPLSVTVNGNPFNVQTGTINLAPGESATIRMEIRNFDREWFDLGPNLDDSINGPAELAAPAGAWMAAFQYQFGSTQYSIPVNINSGGPQLRVRVVDAQVVDQPTAVVVEGAPGLAEGRVVTQTDFDGDISAGIDQIALLDNMDNVLATTPADEANKFALEDFLDDEFNPGGAGEPLELLSVLATGEMQLLISDIQTPTSFDIEFEVISEVPLPAAAWLFLSGLGALMGFRRFRNKA